MLHFTSTSTVTCYLSVTTAAGRDTLLPGPATITYTHNTLYNVWQHSLSHLPPWPRDGPQVHGSGPPATEAECRMLLNPAQLQCCRAAHTALQGHVRVLPAEQESSVILAAFYVANSPSGLVVGCVPLYSGYFDRFLLWLIK